MATPVWQQQQQLRELIAGEGRPVTAKELHGLAVAAGISGFPVVGDVHFVLACGTSDFVRRAGSPTRWYLHPEDPLLSGQRRMADRARWPAEAVPQSPSVPHAKRIPSGEAAVRNSEQRNKAAWDAIELDALVFLSDIGTDVLRVRILSRTRSRTFFRLRFDYVGSPAQPEIWMSGGITNQALMKHLLPSAPFVLSPGLRLPLVATSSDTTMVPTILVWRLPSPSEAAAKLREAVGDLLAVHPKCLTLDAETCSPNELDRRIDWGATVRRLRGRRTRKYAVVSFCDRCGQGLSDPISVGIGIGPECLKFYSRDVLTAVRLSDTQPLRTGAKLPTLWLDEVVQGWTHDQSQLARLGARKLHASAQPQILWGTSRDQ
jgi:hypothetical protein